MATWPASLPQEQFLGLTDQRRAAMRRQAMDVGAAKARPLVRDAVFRNVTVPLILTGAQRLTFDAFYRLDLEDGSLYFDWDDPVTDDTRRFRFRAPPRWELSVGGAVPVRLWATTLELEFQNKIISLLSLESGHADVDLFGRPAVARDGVAFPAGFADVDLFGAATAMVTALLFPEGHSDVESFGTPDVTIPAPPLFIFHNSFSDADLFGTVLVTRTVYPTSHATVDLLGSPFAVFSTPRPETVLASDNLQDTSLASPPVDLTDISDDPATPDTDWWTAVTDHQDIEARLGFPTPAKPPGNVQRFRALLRRTVAGPHPNVDIELWEDGGFVATLLSAVDITSTVGVVKDVSWLTSDLADETGADVEIRIVGHATASTETLSAEAHTDVDLFGAPDVELTVSPDAHDDSDLFGSPTVVSYEAAAVHFDGTNDYLLRGADLDGASDSANGLISVWFRITGFGVQQSILDSSSTRVTVELLSSDVVRIQLRTSGGTNTFAVTTSAIADSDWHHIMVSTNGTTGHCYLDGSSVTPTVSGGTIDWTTGNNSVGARVNGSNKLNGDLADVWQNNSYLDLSDSANRALFLVSGKPVDPAVAVAALGEPLARFSGATATWHTNKGTGGGYTETGALTDGTGPVAL